MDTGSDVTIIPQSDWLETWPLVCTSGTVQGIGGSAPTAQSRVSVQITDSEGNVASVIPYVMYTPLWILGRDTLSQWNMVLYVNPSFW